MAAISDFHIDSALRGRLAEAVKSLIVRIKQHRQYRRTLNELSSLSNRELADLGLNRSMLKQVACDAIYGKRT